MPSKKVLQLVVSGDADQAVKELEKLGSAADKNFDQASKAGAANAQKMQQVGIGMAAAGAAIIAVLGHTAEAYDEQEKADLKLQNTMQNSPKLAGANVAAFNDQASAIQKVTVVADENVTSSQAMLGQFGLTQDQILGLTPLVVDLSEKMGVDLDAASKAVGKAMDGNQGALKKMGINLDGTAYSADHYTAIQKGLSQAVGGFAEQEGKTFSGQVAIMKNQVNELEEGVGKGAVAAFSKLLGPVTQVSSAFKDMPPQMQGIIGTGGAVVGGLLLIGGTALTAVAKLAQLKVATKDAGGGFEGMASEATKASAAVVAGLTLGVMAGEHIADEMKKVQTEAFSGFDPTNFDKSVASLNKAGDEVNALKEKWDAYSPVEKAVHFQEGANLDALANQYYENAAHVEENRKRISDLGHELGITGEQAKQFALDMHVDPSQVPMDQLTAAMKKYKDGVWSADEASQALKKTQGDLATSADEVKKDYDDAKTAMDEYMRKAKEFLGVGDDQMSKTLALRDDLASFGQTLHDNGTQWDWNSNSINENTQKGRDNEKALLDVKGKVLDYGFSVLQTSGNTDQAAAATSVYVDALRRTMLQAGYTQAQADQYIKTLHLTPDDIHTAFDQPGMKDAITNTQNLKGKIDDVKPPVSTSITIDTSQADQALVDMKKRIADFFATLPAGSQDIAKTIAGAAQAAAAAPGHRATGGPVTAGMPYVVGENGQELFVPSTNGTVIPHGQAASGGQPIHLHVMLNGRTIAEEIYEPLTEVAQRAEYATRSG